MLTSLDIEPNSPPPDRCGTCTRCIDACPTNALTPYELDATLCISYFTIELRGPIPEKHHAQMGRHVFGCDICQDVCPWNRRAPVTSDLAFAPREFAPDVILADQALPKFRGLDALHLVRRERALTPVIIVIGSLDEDAAIDWRG